MKICVYSLKGGVGKSAISLNLAIELGAGIFTNDVSEPLKMVLGNSVAQILPNMDFPILGDDEKIIYDLGGYADKRAIPVLKNSDLVIVPISGECSPDFYTSMESIKNIIPYNQNILIVANKSDGDDIEYITNDTRKYYDFPILPLSTSCGMRRIYGHAKKNTLTKTRDFFPNDKGLSISQMAKDSKQLRLWFKELPLQFDDILAFIKANT